MHLEDVAWEHSPATSLTGPQRQAVGKGKSFAMRMEWLGNKLHEQADQAEESLSKDPLAGRHEIIKQEKIKAITRQAMEQSAGNHR